MPVPPEPSHLQAKDLNSSLVLSLFVMNKEVEAGAGVAFPQAGRQGRQRLHCIIVVENTTLLHTVGSVETVQAEEVEQLVKPVMRALGISSDS